mmetsp:Transcript_46163/g.148724  ORF Transcript_46163/g.148724 Transcript_46163/m.148724 type:complete len:423 (-) Transcript_46163:1944-3212(-)
MSGVLSVGCARGVKHLSPRGRLAEDLVAPLGGPEEDGGTCVALAWVWAAVAEKLDALRVALRHERLLAVGVLLSASELLGDGRVREQQLLCEDVQASLAGAHLSNLPPVVVLVQLGVLVVLVVLVVRPVDALALKELAHAALVEVWQLRADGALEVRGHRRAGHERDERAKGEGGRVGRALAVVPQHDTREEGLDARPAALTVLLALARLALARLAFRPPELPHGPLDHCHRRRILGERLVVGRVLDDESGGGERREARHGGHVARAAERGDEQLADDAIAPLERVQAGESLRRVEVREDGNELCRLAVLDGHLLERRRGGERAEARGDGRRQLLKGRLDTLLVVAVRLGRREGVVVDGSLVRREALEPELVRLAPAVRVDLLRVRLVRVVRIRLARERAQRVCDFGDERLVGRLRRARAQL